MFKRTMAVLGCGSSRSFHFLGDGSVDGKINVCTWASSSWSSTSETYTNFYYY